VFNWDQLHSVLADQRVMLHMRRELASLRHRDDAMFEASERADQLLEESDNGRSPKSSREG
jgi:hypothetical protein